MSAYMYLKEYRIIEDIVKTFMDDKFTNMPINKGDARIYDVQLRPMRALTLTARDRCWTIA